MPAKERKRPAGTAATTRLRKLECEHECGVIVRCSRAVMLRGALTCCCGGQLVPAALEDAHAAHEAGVLSAGQLAVHPERLEYERALAGAFHGQAGPARRRMDGGAGFTDPAELAMRRVLSVRAHAAASSRRNALDMYRPNVNRSAGVAEPMPF